mgnify:FL=1
MISVGHFLYTHKIYHNLQQSTLPSEDFLFSTQVFLSSSIKKTYPKIGFYYSYNELGSTLIPGPCVVVIERFVM